MSLPDPRKRPTIRHRKRTSPSNRFIAPIILLGLLAFVLQMAWMRDNWSQVSRRTDHVPLDPEILSRQRHIMQYECEYCLGRGLHNDPENPGERILCAICFGRGYHEARRYYDNDRMCLNCGGMGRVYDEDGDAEFCSRCDGRGMVEIEEALERGVVP